MLHSLSCFQQQRTSLYWKMIKYILVIAALLIPNETAKILLLPGSTNSHWTVVSNVGQALVNTGHEAWILAPDRLEERAHKMGLNTIPWNESIILEAEKGMPEKVVQLFAEGKHMRAMYEIIGTPARKSIKILCHNVLTNLETVSNIERQKFDLAIIENDLDLQESFYILLHKLNIPYISLASHSYSWMIGVPTFTSIEPSSFHMFTSNVMTFFERVTNTLLLLLTTSYLESRKPHPDWSELVPDKAPLSISQLIKKSEFFFVNMEVYCATYPRTMATHMAFIGAANAVPPTPLPDELEHFLSGAQHGVIIVSFGSIKVFADALEYHFDIFLKAFAQIKQKVIMKYVNETSYVNLNIPDNVKLLPWLPQNDLLGHPKTRLFISHGGNGGQMESIYHGVPMISIGVIGEQIFNSYRMQHRGYGVALDIPDLSTDTLVSAINEVLNNPTYIDNTLRCASIIRSMPNSDESIQFWVDHILKYGGAHLRPPSLDMPMYQFLMLDVFLFFTVILLTAMICSWYCIRITCKKCYMAIFRYKEKHD